MRKAALWFGCILLALGMTGCSGGEESAKATGEMAAGTETAANGETAAKEVQEGSQADAAAAVQQDADYSDVEFRIAWWGGDTRNTQTVEIIENFEKQYPNLKIDVEYGSYDDSFTKLTTQATAGNLPDVYMMDYSKIVEYVEAGQMELLDPYIESGVIDLSDVDDSLISGGIVNDGMYALATGVNAPCLFYDPVILEEAGLTLSQNPDWAEISEVIQNVYDKTGYRAYVDPHLTTFEIYLRSIGKEMYSADNSSYGFEGEDFAAYLEDYYNLYATDAALSSAEYNGEVGGSMREGSGNWMKFIGNTYSNNIASAEEEAGKNLYMCCYPSATGAKISGTYLKPVMLWGISSTSQNKELAAAFINYFVNDSSVYDVCGTDRGIPISAAMREYVETNTTEAGKLESEFISFLSDGVATEISAPAPTGSTEANSYLQEVIEKLYYGQLGKDEILDAAMSAVKEGNAILEKTATNR